MHFLPEILTPRLVGPAAFDARTKAEAANDNRPDEPDAHADTGEPDAVTLLSFY
jgi:hypothetical protein